ncbi:hypothetical protein IFM89_036419 [Coptis chinensis]|uniref:Uncharacterized protein n=1 Tax=Coptis chinensis TaxID=261450 RepID=A0A835IKR7_9MAGN|nr:hypothetical protein IFM89_036419 [Coptis chinensis]
MRNFLWSGNPAKRKGVTVHGTSDANQFLKEEEVDNLIMNTKLPNKSLLEIIKDDWDDGDWMDWRQKSGRQSIVLVGLHGSTPYVPLRVLHQFGCVHPFNPTTSDLEDDRVDFTSFSVKKEIRYVQTWEQSRQSISAFVQNNTSTISELNQLGPNGSREFVRDYIIPPPPPERFND